VRGFVESNGFVAIEAEQYGSAVATEPIHWQRIPDLGRTLSAMTPFPPTAASQTPGADSPHLEYPVRLAAAGGVAVRVYASPALALHGAGLRYAVSFDDQPPQTITITDPPGPPWDFTVSSNINATGSSHTLAEAGDHVLKYWMVDAGVVLQKLVIERTGFHPSYLAPTEDYLGPPSPPATGAPPSAEPDPAPVVTPEVDGGGAGGGSGGGGCGCRLPARDDPSSRGAAGCLALAIVTLFAARRRR
jgi:hypothetical protein